MNPPKKIKKQKKSKLQGEAILIFKYWSEGKSLRFICLRLRTKEINCWPSTVMRFINSSISI